MTTFIRQYLLNAYTALPLLVCLLVASWAAQARPLGVSHRYSGEEMFRGLFFLEGRYAEAIPELKSVSMTYSYKLAKVSSKDAIHKTRNQLVATIRAEQPMFFDNFQKAMESGNHLRVESTLRAARKVVEATAERLYKLDMQQIEKLQRQTLKLADEGKLTRDVVEQMAKNLQKEQYQTRQGNGTCIVLPLPPVIDLACSLIVILYCPVVVYVVAVEQTVQADSRLLTEQLVASICQISANPS
ncbi:hypothetical protein [Spirosoma montaniterrae]|uniref:DUF5667 domain-containing protein n=1 Tax=Spirosoma montaniterrae TaxID=1178516 RepID=A0A1P9WZ64_9BACT|nr:hypothetical protein [Spirosoma montaniterrae]AQG80671.1 hypothetical protein AWR27_15855 [Spirosoma montaniterrae]